MVNAGCRITSIQLLMGRRRLNTTLIYARVHDHTVAEDYYAAMEIIEKRHHGAGPAGDLTPDQLGVDPPENENVSQILAMVDLLDNERLTNVQNQAIQALRGCILALTTQSVS